MYLDVVEESLFGLEVGSRVIRILISCSKSHWFLWKST